MGVIVVVIAESCSFLRSRRRARPSGRIWKQDNCENTTIVVVDVHEPNASVIAKSDAITARLNAGESDVMVLYEVNLENLNSRHAGHLRSTNVV